VLTAFSYVCCLGNSVELSGTNSSRKEASSWFQGASFDQLEQEGGIELVVRCVLRPTQAGRNQRAGSKAHLTTNLSRKEPPSWFQGASYDQLEQEGTTKLVPRWIFRPTQAGKRHRAGSKMCLTTNSSRKQASSGFQDASYDQLKQEGTNELVPRQILRPTQAGKRHRVGSKMDLATNSSRKEASSGFQDGSCDQLEQKRGIEWVLRCVLRPTQAGKRHRVGSKMRLTTNSSRKEPPSWFQGASYDQPKKKGPPSWFYYTASNRLTTERLLSWPQYMFMHRFHPSLKRLPLIHFSYIHSDTVNRQKSIESRLLRR
jgi:hypothetical protein